MTQFQLPKLNYDLNALEPELSAETLNYHYNWHHKTYVEKLNQLLPGSGFENQTLDEIVKSATGPLFNNAAQHWNHSFYWRCMKPKAAGKPGVKIGNTLDREFGSFDEFKAKFQKIATEHFGSGWAWLLADSNGKLSVMATHDADNPLHQGKIPLLACDLWEHAYYIDYRSARPDYLKNFWNITNWDFVEQGYSRIGENNILDAQGDEMPDPAEKASDAAAVFKQNQQVQGQQSERSDIKQQIEIDKKKAS